MLAQPKYKFRTERTFTLKPTDKLYYQYAGVISSVVKQYAKKCPDLKDELFLQAQLVFCQACLSYDPHHKSGASFETWLRNKLKSITGIIKKAAHGPCLLKGVGSPYALTWSAIEKEYTDKDRSGDKKDQSKQLTTLLMDEYTSRINDCIDGDSEYPDELLPYFNALKGDALQVFKDFCNGAFERAPTKGMTMDEKKELMRLNPMKLYRRLYKEKGWSIARVTNAWRNLHGIMEAYINGTIPTSVCTKKYVHRLRKTYPRRVNGPNENSRCSKWYFDFEQRHKITYGIYRILKKKGVIPPLDKNRDKNLDLSKYAVMAV